MIKKSNPIISCFADEYNSDPDINLAYLEKEGIRYIEPRFIGKKNISELSEAECREYKAKLDLHGVSASAIGSPLGKINLADCFDAHLEVAKRVFENANILGAERIRMFSFYLREGKTRKEERSEVIDKLGRLLDLADTFGVTLCHENEAKIYGESYHDCFDLLSAFGGRLRAVFDMGNFLLDGHNPFTAYTVLKDYISYFHIKDSLPEGAIVPPGRGEAKILELLHMHRLNSEKDFFITLEPHLETFSGLNKLVGKTFENPYKFNSPEEAFDTALKELRAIIAKTDTAVSGYGV